MMQERKKRLRFWQLPRGSSENAPCLLGAKGERDAVWNGGGSKICVKT